MEKYKIIGLEKLMQDIENTNKISKKIIQEMAVLFPNPPSPTLDDGKLSPKKAIKEIRAELEKCHAERPDYNPALNFRNAVKKILERTR